MFMFFIYLFIPLKDIFIIIMNIRIIIKLIIVCTIELNYLPPRIKCIRYSEPHSGNV